MSTENWQCYKQGPRQKWWCYRSYKTQTKRELFKNYFTILLDFKVLLDHTNIYNFFLTQMNVPFSWKSFSYQWHLLWFEFKMSPSLMFWKLTSRGANLCSCGARAQHLKTNSCSRQWASKSKTSSETALALVRPCIWLQVLLWNEQSLPYPLSVPHTILDQQPVEPWGKQTCPLLSFHQVLWAQYC